MSAHGKLYTTALPYSKGEKNSNCSIDIYQLCALFSHFAGKFALNKDVPKTCEVGHVKNKIV